MIVIAGTVRIPTGALEKVRTAMEPLLNATRAEDGCIRYAFAQDVLDPDLIHVAEAWRDREALKAHFESPHMAEWRTAIGEIGAFDRDLRMFETDEGEPI
ncbi:putative quinol monooxygenase [Altererythrobacter sp.]|uniref:putative quinol monooxygenase n=1 Tax=Altererythrobacter sp. TaxID=1872480 RepID=UPI003D029A7A